jgi:hypothetical protein
VKEFHQWFNKLGPFKCPNPEIKGFTDQHTKKFDNFCKENGKDFKPKPKAPKWIVSTSQCTNFILQPLDSILYVKKNQ